MFFDELAQYLEDSGVGTPGEDIFIGLSATVPRGEGPFLSVIETGGTNPEYTHNATVMPAYQRPSAQLVFRAKDPIQARALALKAYKALFAVRNMYLSGRDLEVASLTRSGDTVTVTTTVDHLYQTGHIITIEDAVPSEFNGDFPIEVTDDNTFTYEKTGLASGFASGAVAHGHCWYLHIYPVQEPFELPTDEVGRARWAFNIRVTKRPS